MNDVITKKLPMTPAEKRFYDNAARRQLAKRQAEFNSNAEVQRRKLMTKEERHRAAIDRCTERHVDFEKKHGNTNPNAEAIRQTYVDIARRTDQTGGKG